MKALEETKTFLHMNKKEKKEPEIIGINGKKIVLRTTPKQVNK